MRILLVEDDTLLGEGLYAGLQRENYSLDWIKNGETALIAMLETAYDAVILDIGLPKMSGLDVLRQARSEGNKLPVLILTARDAVSDRVDGLDAGADDYLVKPFEFSELCARLRALTRRARGLTEQLIRYKNIQIDPAAHSVKLNNQQVELSRREFSLLEELLSNIGRVLSKAQLEEKLYSWGDEIGSNTIEVHIHHLRKKFGSEFIKTVRGVGYIVAKES
ncbi:MAG: response regulator [Gammaproteobacteria bacterium]|nr:response regulator [Gammaproteobacteria bacterium]